MINKMPEANRLRLCNDKVLAREKSKDFYL